MNKPMAIVIETASRQHGLVVQTASGFRLYATSRETADLDGRCFASVKAVTNIDPERYINALNLDNMLTYARA